MWDYIAAQQPEALPKINMFEYMASKLSTWHVVNKDGMSFGVFPSKEEAEDYRDNAIDGYYSHMEIKEETEHYAHWSKSFTTKKALLYQGL